MFNLENSHGVVKYSEFKNTYRKSASVIMAQKARNRI